ncbi:MAG: hypothetical protein CMO26_10665 [Thiotrichales bacterium]|nr:hypothetical protein [Thiotrichales bacterium]|tara:strand:- start:487 stop:804 length:318 start_codon:yes stop_codon:yes gene_type:complete
MPRLTIAARTALEHELEGRRNLGLILRYAAGDAGPPDHDIEPAIWETVEAEGWKLAISSLVHLPAQAITHIDGLAFFVAGDSDGLTLDHDGVHFLMDGRPCELER